MLYDHNAMKSVSLYDDSLLKKKTFKPWKALITLYFINDEYPMLLF